MQYARSSLHSSLSQQHRSEVIVRSLDHLFAMAQQYRSEGSLRQAMEIYWTLSENHSETVQGQGAQDGLLELADVYEHDGSRHQARSIYERLS
ncbi:MAG: tol-pal system YbgF family protein [Hyphomicrobiales bacterium]